jgi:hypothetical protein
MRAVGIVSCEEIQGAQSDFWKSSKSAGKVFSFFFLVYPEIRSHDFIRPRSYRSIRRKRRRDSRFFLLFRYVEKAWLILFRTTKEDKRTRGRVFFQGTNGVYVRTGFNGSFLISNGLSLSPLSHALATYGSKLAPSTGGSSFASLSLSPLSINYLEIS